MSFYNRGGYSPDISIGYLVRLSHSLGQQGMEPIFSEAGLTSTQWSALIAIHWGRGGTGAELARDLAHDKGATARIIETLAANGWITRERSADDRRCINLALTEAGHGVAMGVLDRVIVLWNGWLKDWPEDEITTLITLLQKLRTTLDHAVRGEPA